MLKMRVARKKYRDARYLRAHAMILLTRIKLRGVEENGVVWRHVTSAGHNFNRITTHTNSLISLCPRSAIRYSAIRFRKIECRQTVRFISSTTRSRSRKFVWQICWEWINIILFSNTRGDLDREIMFVSMELALERRTSVENKVSLLTSKLRKLRANRKPREIPCAVIKIYLLDNLVRIPEHGSLLVPRIYRFYRSPSVSFRVRPLSVSRPLSRITLFVIPRVLSYIYRRALK